MKKHSIKLTALVLALVLTAALALTGCGSKSDCSGARSLANRARSVSNITPA